jgi:fatty acid desaturase
MTETDPSSLQQILSMVGWVPTVIFPAATVVKLFAIARRGRADGATALTWSLFAVANVCLYLTIGEWTRPQVVISTLGTAVLQVVVVALALRLRATNSKATATGAVSPVAPGTGDSTAR